MTWWKAGTPANVGQAWSASIDTGRVSSGRGHRYLMSGIPRLKLNNGVAIPQLGFGVFQVPPEQTEKTVTSALEAGYRSIDTHAGYRNEAGVGAAVARSGLPRGELFITTKLANGDQGYDQTLRAFDDSMGKLGLDFVDLYLIHWPRPDRDEYVATWKAFEKIHADGRVRAIGVSNFQPVHLRRLFDETDVVPAVNQIELHPQFIQAELREFHREHGIATEAWSPLAQGAVLGVPLLTGISQKYGKTPRSGGAPLASAARQRGDPQVSHPVPDAGEPRRPRLRTRRR